MGSDDFERLNHRMERFEQSQDELKALVLRQLATCELHRTGLVQLQHTVYGTNGNPGLRLEVDRLKQDRRRRYTVVAWIAALCSSLLVAAVSTGLAWLLQPEPGAGAAPPASGAVHRNVDHPKETDR